MMNVRLKSVEHQIFRSSLVLLADYRCDPSNPLFSDSGPSNANAMIFPLTCTRIIRSDAVFIENPTAVALYNEGVEYSSVALSAEGSYCHWMTLDEELLYEIAGASPRLDGPFRVTQVAMDAATALRQRTLFRHAGAGGDDAFTIEEEAIAIAIAVLSRPSSCAPAAGATVRRAIEWIASHFYDSSSLADAAADIGVSPAYLSRAFRAAVGSTMHAFREDLRLRRALDLLPDSAGDFIRLALDLGYSSHSHFTYRFRHKFGVTPQEYVGIARGPQWRLRRDAFTPRLSCR